MTASPDAPAVPTAPGTASAARTARLFRIAAHVEAVSWTCLLVGMFFKYVVVHDEIGVKVFGPIHGVAFVGYVLATIAARGTFGWSWRLFLAALAASIPPLLTWPFERYATRRGALGAPA